MTEQTPDTTVTVPPSPSVSGEMNGPRKVTMYLQGRPIDVLEADVATMQAAGALVYGKEDLEKLPEELGQLAIQVVDSARRFVQGVVGDGYIDVGDASEGRALQQAMNLLAAKANDIVTIAGINYPVREAGETDADRLDRLARDVKYHGFGQDELRRRYGLDEGYAAEVFARSQEIAYEAPGDEQYAQLAAQDGSLSQWMKRSDVPDDQKDRIVSVRSGLPPQPVAEERQG